MSYWGKLLNSSLLTIPSPSSRPVVVLVEDESDLSGSLRRILEKEKFSVSLARDANEALWVLRRIAARKLPLLTIVEFSHLHTVGPDVIAFIRGQRDLRRTPILAISAESDPETRIRALDGGADDFLAKPFGSREFLARIRMLSRSYFEEVASAIPDVSLRVGPLSIDTARREVLMEGREIRLTRHEFRILHFLALHHGRILSKEEILAALWGEDEDVSDETLKVHISAIRKKIGDTSQNSQFIETRRGFGYRLKARPS